MSEPGIAEPDRPAGRQPPITDYGFLSDCHSAVLVDRNGSVDWWCLPRFDSPSVLGRLLDPHAGHWALRPVGEFTTERSYIDDTLVLRTVFRTPSGVVSITDALALEPGARGHDIGLRSPHVLLRRVEGLTGSVAMRSDLNFEHLAGYRDSSPVRVGNAAWQQDQLDVFGEVLDAAHLLQDTLGELTPAVQQLLVALADRAAASWTEPDAGMWEARDARRHYVSSKVMCWVALDRAVQLADRLGEHADPQAWATARDAVRAAVLAQAWSDVAGAYAGAFGSDDLDASVLLLPIVGFLPASDERMRATIEAVESQLGAGGLIRRWPSDPSGFLICTYWLVECLSLAGLQERALTWWTSATAHANDLGLLSEEADPSSGDLLGNYPQAFSHVGLINAAWRLGQAEKSKKTN